VIQDLPRALHEASPEVRLLVCSARTRVDPDTAESIRALLRADIDWRLLLRMAWQHGTTPLLYSTLHSVGDGAVPPAILDEIRGYFHANTGRVALLTRELLRLLQLFEGNGVHAVPFKGPVLAATAYGNIALQMFSDLDVLVRKEQLPTLCRILADQGYRCPQDRLTPGRLDAFRHLFNQHHFVCARNSVAVEPHWEVIRGPFGFAFDTRQLWDRAGTIPLAGIAVRTLAPEDVLLLLCAHGTQHLWSRLAWICDIAELIRAHPALDWETTVDRAARMGGERALLQGLQLAHDLLNAMLPAAILHRAQAEPKARARALQVSARLFQELRSDPDPFSMVLFHIRMRERLRDKVLYVLRAAASPTYPEFDAFPLSTPFLFLYPLMLPLWRLLKHGSRFFRSPGRVGRRPR
jgi:hypothetical protein